MKSIAEILAEELSQKLEYIENVIALMDEGNTIPFIARYRKEMHGAMDDTTLRNLETRLTYLRNLQERREEVKRAIENQGKLTEELTEAGLSVSSSVPTDIEIMSHNAGKGSTVKWLANHIGATFDQTMAFGDNTNDLQMLQSVAWPVAMGNAVEELKAAARIIAPHCAENGVAKTIAKYVFGREE